MSARHFDYYDNWKTEILTCPKCGWTGTFEQGDVEHHDELMDCSCPQCPWPDDPMLAIVSYATMAETEANIDKLSEREKDDLAQRKQFLAEVERTSLKSPGELPDLPEPEIVLLWDFKEEQDGTSWTVIRHGGEILWSERAVYEGAERFMEVMGILRQKYGNRLVDLCPTDASSLYLYGDRIRTIDWIEQARASLRESPSQ